MKLAKRVVKTAASRLSLHSPTHSYSSRFDGYEPMNSIPRTIARSTTEGFVKPFHSARTPQNGFACHIDIVSNGWTVQALATTEHVACSHHRAVDARRA